jgi:hypothetical protein
MRRRKPRGRLAALRLDAVTGFWLSRCVLRSAAAQLRWRARRARFIPFG